MKRRYCNANMTVSIVDSEWKPIRQARRYFIQNYFLPPLLIGVLSYGLSFASAYVTHYPQNIKSSFDDRLQSMSSAEEKEEIAEEQAFERKMPEPRRKGLITARKSEK